MAGCVVTKTNAALTAITLRIRRQWKKPFKRTTPGPSNLDRILDRSCQIHGTPEKPANHTNRDCWVFKQAGKLIAENNDKGLHSDDEEETWPPNSRGQKGFPPQVRTVNMIYATHIPKREQKRALRDVYAMEPVAPKFNPWSSCPITPPVSAMADSPHWS